MFCLFEHGASAEVYQVVVYRRETFYKIIVDIALGNGHLLQFRGNPAEADSLGADKETGIALAAEPDQVRRQNLISQTQDDHVDESARIKIVHHLTDRTDTGACTAGITGLDLLQADLLCYFILEIRVHPAKFNRIQCRLRSIYVSWFRQC